VGLRAEWAWRAESPVQRLDEPVDGYEFRFLGANQPAQASGTGQIAGLVISGKRRGVRGQFFVDLGTLVFEQPPVIVGLAPIGTSPVGDQADHLASGRVHRAHAIRSDDAPPLE
jgi:hypothetical protein